MEIDDDEIYGAESDYGDEARVRREAREAEDDEYLDSLRRNGSTACTKDTSPVKDIRKDAIGKKFDRRFINKPVVPVPVPMTSTSAPFGPAQTVQATAQSTVPQNGSSSAAYGCVM